eukprot:3982112-Pyramimonas_sp.AAC.1
MRCSPSSPIGAASAGAWTPLLVNGCAEQLDPRDDLQRGCGSTLPFNAGGAASIDDGMRLSALPMSVGD